MFFEKLKDPKEFQNVYKKTKGAHTSSCVIFVLKQENIKKVGFTASKKVGNAVYRNRAKRRLRAIFSEFKDKLQSGTYIFVAKEAIKDTTYKSLQSDIERSLKKTGGLDAKKGTS